MGEEIQVLKPLQLKSDTVIIHLMVYEHISRVTALIETDFASLKIRACYFPVMESKRCAR